MHFSKVVLYSVHFTCILWCFAYTYENEIAHQDLVCIEQLVQMVHSCKIKKHIMDDIIMHKSNITISHDRHLNVTPLFALIIEYSTTQMKISLSPLDPQN